MAVRPRARTAAALSAGAVAVLALGSGIAVAASTDGPEADLCVAAGQPVLAARTDDAGAPVCPSARTLARVAGQQAVDDLEHALLLQSQRVDELDGRLRTLQDQANALGSRLSTVDQRTALSVRTSSAMPAARPDGTLTDLAATVSCGTTARAVSGSAELTDARLTVDHLSADGTSWVFRAPSTKSTSRAVFRVVCAGAAPAGGGGTTPGTATGPG